MTYQHRLKVDSTYHYHFYYDVYILGSYGYINITLSLIRIILRLDVICKSNNKQQIQQTNYNYMI